jgi:hypothetical protein
VRERDPWELATTVGYDNDRLGRANAGVLLRPIRPSWPAVVLAGGTIRRFAREAYAGIEPRTLTRGGPGWFLRAGVRRTDTRIFASDRSQVVSRTERVEAMLGGQFPLPLGDIVQIGAGVARIWSGGTTREGALGALRLETLARPRRWLDAVALAGPQRYASVEAGFSPDLPLGPVTLRPAITAGWASEGSPLDELHGLGGPSSLVGLRHEEWLGRRKVGIELRLLRDIAGGLQVHVHGQAGRVDRSFSRADLDGRARVAAGLGIQANVPFGPVALDWGITEGGVHRVDASLGTPF